jgi:hypothetical protein
LAEKSNVKLPGMPFLEIKDGCVILPSGLRIAISEPAARNASASIQEWIFDSKGGISKLYGGKAARKY